MRSDLVFADSVPELLSRVGIRMDGYGVGTHRILCPRPECQGKHNKNLAVTIKSDQDVTWVCHRCGWNNKGFLVRSANWTPGPRKAAPVRPAPAPTDDDEKRRNFERIQRRYAKAKPIATVGKTYFQSRGILGPLPDCLREENYPPCIIAPFTDISTNEVRGFHCTWLKFDGSGKADIPVPRKIYGKYGGCAIKLTEDAEVTYGLAVAEGVETALSVREAGFPCWALGSAGNLAKFPVLDGIEALTIFADNDESGTGLKAAHECASRWHEAKKAKGHSVEVRIIMPKHPGHDFNDALNVARARHG